MKAKYLLLGFLILTFGAFCATVNTRASDYELGVSENDELILEIKIVDEEGLEDLFQQADLEDGGNNWQYNLFLFPPGPIGTAVFFDFGNENNLDEVGAKLKLQVDWINESDDYVIYDVKQNEKDEIDAWTVFFNIWAWVDPHNDFNPKPTHVEIDAPLYVDQEDYNIENYDLIEEKSYVDIYFIGLYGLLIPTPVENYLDDIEWRDEDLDFNIGEDWYDEDEMKWDYDLENTKLTLERTFAWDDDPPDEDWEYEDYIEEWTWDENTGWLSLYQLMNDDEEVIYEVAAVGAIPGYELPILLGVTTAFTIGLIYVIRKRK